METTELPASAGSSFFVMIPDNHCEGPVMLNLCVKVFALVLTPLIIVSMGRTSAVLYPIHLDKPSHAGDTFSISVKASEDFSSHWTDPGDTKPPTEIHFHAALEGAATVVAVSPSGRVTGLSVRIKSCSKDGVEVLKRGTVISCQNTDGVEHFSINGNATAKDEHDLLANLIYVSRPDEPTAEEQFGTDKLRKIGEKWPAHLDQLAKAPHLPYELTDKDFYGQVRLLNVDVVGDQFMNTIEMIESCKFDSRTGANGKTYKNLWMTFRSTDTSPAATDVAYPATSVSVRAVKCTIESKDGIEVTNGTWQRDVTSTNVAKTEK